LSKEKIIRRIESGDVDAVVGVWHRAGLDAYTYLPTWQAFTLEQAHGVFREVIYPNCDIWVGLHDGVIVAYLAMKASYVDRLYVDPHHQRKGWGQALMTHAKTIQPTGLELHTHVANHGARALYEKLGFVAVRFGISPPPEKVPDVEYHWRPSQ
jgi:putative acetyltransferase